MTGRRFPVCNNNPQRSKILVVINVLLKGTTIIISTRKLKKNKYDTKETWYRKVQAKRLLIGHIGIKILIISLVIVPPDSFMVQKTPCLRSPIAI